MSDHDLTSRDRLLDAAERLFGENGIRATSIRDLTQEAQVNLAAVNYHFGSKEKLIAAVLARRADPVNRHRMEMLDQVLGDAAGQPAPVEAILSAMSIPTVGFLRSNPSFFKFAARLWSEPEKEFRQVLMAQFGFVAQRFVGELSRTLPHIPVSSLWIRFNFAIGSMLHTWMHLAEACEWSRLPQTEFDVDRVMNEWVRFSSAGIRAEAGQTAGGTQIA
jgi:AcrR family transcriptional regulator